jgi:thiol-disulfide isomerase/thioredoxin
MRLALRLLPTLLLPVLALLLGGLASFAQAADAQLVMFTATWCASCRDVMPVVERLASGQGLPIVLIDVDEPNAPQQASSKGLAIPSKELPQVYLLQANRASLVFDGEGYVLGHRMAAQQSLTAKINQATGK